MATKKELEDQIKLLKDEVRRLRSEAKTVEANSKELDSLAHGVVIMDNNFKLVEVKFDVEKGQAIIGNVKDLGKGLAVAASGLKKAVIDRLVAANKGR